MKCTMELQIDHHTGNYVPLIFMSEKPNLIKLNQIFLICIEGDFSCSIELPKLELEISSSLGMFTFAAENYYSKRFLCKGTVYKKQIVRKLTMIFA